MESVFPWQQTCTVLLDLAREHELEPEPRRQRFSAFDGERRPLLHVQLPPLQPMAPDCSSVDDYTGCWSSSTQNQACSLIVLLQAGASALGIYEADELVQHKVFKRYVVRGQGRAQPTHLKTRGKSRYGSRLRLQQARRLLQETNERMQDWAELYPIDQAFYSAPVRLWPELFAADPPPPLPHERFVRIPRDLGTPSLEQLKRAFRETGLGRVIRLATPEP